MTWKKNDKGEIQANRMMNLVRNTRGNSTVGSDKQREGEKIIKK